MTTVLHSFSSVYFFIYNSFFCTVYIFQFLYLKLVFSSWFRTVFHLHHEATQILVTAPKLCNTSFFCILKCLLLSNFRILSLSKVSGWYLPRCCGVTMRWLFYLRVFTLLTMVRTKFVIIFISFII